MTNKRRILIFFVGFILLIYIYGVLHGVVYQSTLDQLTSVNLDKSTFFDVADPENTIQNREIQLNESKIYKYRYDFTLSELDVLDLSDYHNENIYLMIEKPDAQYIEIQLNNETIGDFGDQEGQANIWNGIYFIRFNENLLMADNELTIMMYSDYMTGVSGSIRLLAYDEYREIESITTYSYDLIKSATVIAFVIAILIALIVIAWYKELYNIRVYIYFLISIVFLGISLFDFRIYQTIPFDYLIYKKFIIISYHMSITFATLAISYMLNAKYKFNIGMVSLFLILYYAFTTDTMVAWRDVYQVLNVFLLVTIIQLVATLVYYRKRALESSMVLIFAFSLAGISVGKLVYITSMSIESTMLIDMPILIILYAAVVLFVFYNEMLQMVKDQEIVEEYRLSLNGSFTLDKRLRVIGQYSNSCNAIFDKLIVGAHLSDLMSFEDFMFVEDIFESIFDPSYEFLDGFIDLLPSEVTIRDRNYVIFYHVYERLERMIKITLNDVTKSKSLEKTIEEERKLRRFIINALKSKEEMGYFINKTRRFIEILKSDGFTEEHQKTLHTLKGNLGQFGFVHFEKSVHEIEDKIKEEDINEDLIGHLEDSLDQAISLLERHIGSDYFSEAYDVYTVRRTDISQLENAYRTSEHVDMMILNQIKSLRNIDIRKMISRYNQYIEQLARKLNKAVLPLEINGPAIMIQPEKAEQLIMVLVGIFRNAITHGIEVPEERVAIGKDSYGQIKCDVSINDQAVQLVLSDDGQGIDLDAIRRRAIEDGIIRETDQYSSDDLLNFIFMAKLSTRDQADLIAGRGVGLAAVVDVVEDMKGTMSVSTELFKGTRFEITIPLKSLRD